MGLQWIQSREVLYISGRQVEAGAMPGAPDTAFA